MNRTRNRTITRGLAAAALATLGFPASALAYGEFTYPNSGKFDDRPAGYDEALPPTAVQVKNDTYFGTISAFVYAARAGTVTRSDRRGVALTHESGYETRYLRIWDGWETYSWSNDVSVGQSISGHPHRLSRSTTCRFSIHRYGAPQHVPGVIGASVGAGDPIPVTYPGLDSDPGLRENGDYVVRRKNGRIGVVRGRDVADSYPTFYEVTDPRFAGFLTALMPDPRYPISINGTTSDGVRRWTFTGNYVNATLAVVPGTTETAIRIAASPGGTTLSTTGVPGELVKVLDFQSVGNERWVSIESKTRVLRGWVARANLVCRVRPSSPPSGSLSSGGASWASGGSSSSSSGSSSGSSSSSSGSSGSSSGSWGDSHYVPMGLLYDPTVALYYDTSSPRNWYDAWGNKVDHPHPPGSGTWGH